MERAMSEITEWRKKWSHQPTPIPPDATGLWYSETCVDQMLADYHASALAAKQAEIERLLTELNNALKMIAPLALQETRDYAIKLTREGHYENKRITDLERKLAELEWRPITEWISVKERLPENGCNVIICLLGICPFVGHYNHGKKKWRMGSETRDRQDGGIVAVTHWMPLPAAPKGADHE